MTVADLEAELAELEITRRRLISDLRKARNAAVRAARPTKPCGACGKPLPWTSLDGAPIPPATYARRKYCDHVCRSRVTNAARRVEREPRICLHCRRSIPTRNDLGHLIKPEAWERRKYCNAACRSGHYAAMKAVKVQVVKPKLKPKPRKARKPAPRPTLTLTSVRDAIREYRGIPLTAEEVCDHLNLSIQNRSKAARILRHLVAEGEVSVKSPGLYFDAAAWEAAA